MTSSDPGALRTRQAVEREYGQVKWPRFERLIEEQVRSEPDAGFARILGRVAREQWRREDPLATAPFTAGGGTVELPPSASYGAGQGLVLELVAQACREDTGLVIELGSGWGWHILTCWARGGPREATYVAAEFTEAGRRAASALARLDEQLRFRAVAFDYHEPVLDDLGPAEHAVVFSAHSIEQIPSVRPELFAAIRGVAKRVTCVHLEPVGFQVEGHDGLGTSAVYADEHDYNRNLVAAVRAEADAGRIVLETVRPDVFGINARNATTIVQWRSETPA